MINFLSEKISGRAQISEESPNFYSDDVSSTNPCSGGSAAGDPDSKIALKIKGQFLCGLRQKRFYVCLELFRVSYDLVPNSCGGLRVNRALRIKHSTVIDIDIPSQTEEGQLTIRRQWPKA